MAKNEIALLVNRIDLINLYQDRIERLFGVKLVFERQQDTSSSSFPYARSQLYSNRNNLRIQSSSLNPSHLEKPKAFVLSLNAHEDERYEKRAIYNPVTYAALFSHYDWLEQHSQAVFTFHQDGRTLSIWGLQENVDCATKLVESKLTSMGTPSAELLVTVKSSYLDRGEFPVQVSRKGFSSNRNIVFGKGYEPFGCQVDVSKMTNMSPGNECNYDSCYDSDGSPSTSRHTSRRSSCVKQECANHQELNSHAQSDIYVAGLELEGKLTPQLSPVVVACDEVLTHNAVGEDDSTPSHAACDSESDSESDSSINHIYNPNYKCHIAKALKLGYTENQLKQALQRLGNNVNQNELLSELITLDSQHKALTPTDSIDGYMSDGEQAEPEVIAELVKAANRKDDTCNLRYIVIDGSNVAMSHGNKEVFSCTGIRLAIEWFAERGHRDITAFVPQWRKEQPRPDTPIKDQEVLLELEKANKLVFTPARWVRGKRVVCYDDRYIIKLAADTGGIVVSNDNYRDLLNERPEYQPVIEERLLMYSFVNDRFMPPDDPLGRHGPKLEIFLHKDSAVSHILPPKCPYERKCTYGNKCKYYHPERGQQPHMSVTDKLVEAAKVKIQEVQNRSIEDLPGGMGSKYGAKRTVCKTMSLTLPRKQPLGRTTSLNAGLSVSTKDISDTRAEFGNILTGKLQKVLSPQVTLTIPTPTDHSKTEEDVVRDYKRCLAEQKCITKSGAVQCENKLQNPSSDETEPLLQGLGLQAVAWNSMRAPLRPTHSDPPSQQYERLGSGHLALAKKLSDEGKSADYIMCGQKKQSIKCVQSNPSLPTSSGGILSEPGIAAQKQESGHRKLVRQFSYSGADDHRIHKKLGRIKSQNPMSGPQSLLSQQQWPFGSADHIQHPPPVLPKASSLKYSHQSSVQGHCNAMQSNKIQIRDQRCQTQHPGAQRNPLIIACDGHKKFNKSNVSVSDTEPGNQLLSPYPAHKTVERMASAPNPITKIQFGQLPVPSITRQNSTSDPQLNIFKDNQLSKDGVSYVLKDSYIADNAHYGHLMFQTPPKSSLETTCFGVGSGSDRSKFEDVFKYSTDEIVKVSHSNDEKMNYDLAESVQLVSPTHISPSTETAEQASLEHRQCGYTGKHNSLQYEKAQEPYIRYNDSLGHVGSEEIMLNHSVTDPGADLHVTVCELNNSTVPTSISYKPPSNSDPRYKIYVHLSGLFDERKVCEVMARYPHERDPKKLIAEL